MLLFSFGTTLKTWVDQGLIERENRYYGHFKKHQTAVSFLTYGENDLDYQDSISVARILPKKHINHLLIYAAFAPFIYWKQFRQTTIFKSNQSQGALVGLMGKLVSPKSKFVVRCGWVRTREMMIKEQKLKGWRLKKAVFLEWLGFRFSDAIIVVTPSDARYVVDNYRIPEKKITVVPNAVDEQLFAYHTSSTPISEKLKIVLIGRLVEMKNFHGVLEAVAKVGHPAEITIIGDGPYKQELIRIQEKFGLDVRFLSNLGNDQIPFVLNEHNVFIMTQFYASGMPKVILEAMSAGLITINSDIRTHRELIQHGENGLLCGSEVSAMVDMIESLLKLPESEIDRIRANARNDIETKYAMPACVEKENTLFRSLLA